MIGTYRLFLDGKFISESKNLITDYGKLAVLRYLAGITDSYAGAIAVGISDATPTTSDSILGYEVSSASINLKSIDYENSEILFKATINSKTKISVKEIGLFPDNASSRSSIIYYFDSSESWGNIDSRNLTDGRVGDSGVDKQTYGGTPETLTISDQLNFADLLSTDAFSLAFITYDNNCDYISIQFTDINGDTMIADTTDSVVTTISHTEDPDVADYHIYEIPKSAFTGQDKAWNQIVRVEIIIQPKAASDSRVVLDALKTTDSNIPAGSEIVSKTTLAESVTKEQDSTLDIEYSLSVPI